MKIFLFTLLLVSPAYAIHDFESCEPTKFEKGIGTGNNSYNGHDCVVKPKTKNSNEVLIQTGSTYTIQTLPSRDVASETGVEFNGKNVSPSNTGTSSDPVYDYADVELPHDYDSNPGKKE